MKTLYEILEVSENASNEIIEKAYKVLAKKYHPDLWTQDKKEYAEQKMKEINEAYDVLSNEIKRKEYNSTLEIERKRQMELKMQEELKKQSQSNTQETHPKNNNSNYSANKQKQEQYTQSRDEYLRRQEDYRKTQEEIKKNMQADYEQKYQNAYENYLKRLGYKIKYKWTWKDYKNFIISILILILICVALWFFPITHNWIIEFYNSNPIIKTIIDIIGSIFVGIWNAITSIFKK